MNFGQALEAAKARKRIARAGWNGKGMWVALHVPVEGHPLLPYLYMKTVDEKIVPWLASQTDMLAEDWSVVPPSEACEACHTRLKRCEDCGRLLCAACMDRWTCAHSHNSAHHEERELGGAENRPEKEH